MLTGLELGRAIEDARLKKGLSKKALAAHFGVKPPSVQDWVKRGTIDKEKLPMLWELFSDVVEPSHWGLASLPSEPASSSAQQVPPDLDAALPVVLGALHALPPARWVSVRAQLDQLAAHPEMRDDVLAELLALLQAGPAKRQAGA